MNRFLRAGIFLLGMVLLSAVQANASSPATFVILPFSVQGPQGFAYLERSLPQMLTSRLYWKDRAEPARHELPANVQPPRDEAAAENLRVQYKADYVIWGSVSIIGDDCSLDVHVRDKTGKIWPYARQSRTPQLMASITGVSESINREIFNRPSSPVTKSTQNAEQGPINRMNPEIMVNETSSREVYLNPQFRYAGASGADSSRLQSQTLPFSSIGMEVLDADGNGKKEIFILTDHRLYAYTFSGNQLKPAGEFHFPQNNQCLSIRSLPRPTGKAWIIVNAIDQGGEPRASILTYSGGTFTEEMRYLRYYLNVVKLPPDYRPTLIGQQAQPPRLFKKGVTEMVKQGDTLVPGRRIALPNDANVFNFTYLPAGRGEQGGEKTIVLSNEEQLRTYNSKGARLAQTTETFSGSSFGLEIDPSIPGLQRDNVTIASVFYIPIRMLAIDLERDGNWELLVNKPISTASQIFDRYRSFPQSEIQSLFWDGLGMNLQWKTRRIKGSMVDFAIADADNNGIPDLVTCINTHPGALGVKARKTVIMLYPLDLSRTNPGVAVDRSEVDE